MATSECIHCGELFWTDEPDDEKCVTCIEQADEESQREAAAEQYSRYIQTRRITKL